MACFVGLGISCCCQQESAHENGSFKVGWLQQCLNNGLSWHIVWNIASSLSNLLVMSVKLPSIYCVGKSPIVLLGLLCGWKLWPWMFQILNNFFVQMEGTSLYCFCVIFFHRYLDVNCKYNCHRWPVDFHERKLKCYDPWQPLDYMLL
jgi:hypothetical protein